jgi:hypothetical protein
MRAGMAMNGFANAPMTIISDPTARMMRGKVVARPARATVTNAHRVMLRCVSSSSVRHHFVSRFDPGGDESEVRGQFVPERLNQFGPLRRG